MTPRRARSPFTPVAGAWAPAEVWVVWDAAESGHETDDYLSDDERERATRYLRLADRVRFVSCRSGLRRILADRLGCRPQDVEFATEGHGKPVLRHSAVPLWFNVSHSADIGLVAVADAPVGVDIERIEPGHSTADAAAMFLTTRELAAWGSLNGLARVESFFTCWTRKEAFAKASGAGFGGMAPERVELCFCEAPGLTSFFPANGYVAAIAVAG